jgi:hypothetical protein
VNQKQQNFANLGRAGSTGLGPLFFEKTNAFQERELML